MTRSNSPARRQQGKPALPTNPRQVSEQLVTWEGPVPPPQVIEAYDRLVPGSAQIMWQNFDDQSNHRRSLEQTVVTNSEARANRGQFISAGLLVLALLCGLIIALQANAVAGAAVIVGTLASGAAIYIAGGRPQNERPPDEGSDA